LVTFKKAKPKPQSLSRSHIRDLWAIGRNIPYKMKNIRKTILILIVIFSSNLIHATEQVPDYLYYKNKKLTMNTGWGHPSPLQTYYYQNNIDYPFTWLSTANYRGHVAIWKVKDDKLFLKEIQINKDSYKPEKYSVKSKSDSLNKNGEVFADWFSGVIACQSDDSYYFYVRYGEVLGTEVITKKDYKKIEKISEKYTSNHELMNKYSMLILNQNYISYYFRLSKEDTIAGGGKGGFFVGQSGFSPILQYYSNDHMKWPYNWENFEKNGAPNCVWLINDKKVFLEKIRLYSGTGFYEIAKDTVRLETLFQGRVSDDKVFADWLNGIYIIKYGTENEDDLFPAYKEFTPTEFTYLRIKKGIIQESYTIPSDFDFKNIPEDTEPGLKKILDEL